MFSCFFIWDHGVGAHILSGIFELSTLTPVKGIKVSRAIMTLETKGAHRILCGSIEILYGPSSSQCLPIESAEVEAGLHLCSCESYEFQKHSEAPRVSRKTNQNPLTRKQLRVFICIIQIEFLKLHMFKIKRLELCRD